MPGVTNNRRRPAGDSNRAKALITARSGHDSRGLATCRRNTAAHGISAVPVADDDDRVIGVVPEADLLCEEEFRER